MWSEKHFFIDEVPCTNPTNMGMAADISHHEPVAASIGGSDTGDPEPLHLPAARQSNHYVVRPLGKCWSSESPWGVDFSRVTML